MRKLLIVCVLVLFFGAGNAMAQNYAVAIDGSKPFVREVTLDEGQITFDIYLENAPGQAYAGGAWVDFSGSTDNLSYVSAGRAFTDSSEGVAGPWEPGVGVIVNEPMGLGTLMIKVAQLAGGGALPDGDGDIIVARVTLEYTCVCPSTASITITTIPGVATWGPSPPDGFWDDDAINAATVNPVLVVNPVWDCTTDADCDDGLWCTGVETCSDFLCIPGTPPCDDYNECSFDHCREAYPYCGSDTNCELIEGMCHYYCDLAALVGPASPCMMDPYCGSLEVDIDEDSIPNEDDNCVLYPNSDQSDQGDGDGVGDACDNCPYDYNPDQGDNDHDGWGDACDPIPDNDGIPYDEDNCPETPNPNQLDTYPPQGNNIGDACDCESDFNCDGNVDATDVTSFLTDFARSTFNNPCTNADPCNGDVDCNVNVDADDVTMFLGDFGRSQFNNPCPACEVGNWCLYEGDPFIREYSDSSCLGMKQGEYSSSAFDECNIEDWATSEVVGDSIYVSVYVTYNCCSSIEVELSDEGNNLNVLVQEIFDRACFCNCCFRVDTEIAGLTPNEYTLEICSQGFNSPPVCETVVVVVP